MALGLGSIIGAFINDKGGEMSTSGLERVLRDERYKKHKAIAGEINEGIGPFSIGRSFGKRQVMFLRSLRRRKRLRKLLKRSSDYQIGLIGQGQNWRLQ